MLCPAAEKDLLGGVLVHCRCPALVHSAQASLLLMTVPFPLRGAFVLTPLERCVWSTNGLCPSRR